MFECIKRLFSPKPTEKEALQLACEGIAAYCKGKPAFNGVKTVKWDEAVMGKKEAE